MKVPDADGVPPMVIVSFTHDAATPAGKPEAVPIPVAPVVLLIILVNGELMQSDGVLDAALTVLFA